MTTSPRPSMETHPDLVEMRLRHEMAERATSTAQGQAVEALALLTGVYLAASPWIAGFNGLSTLAVTNLIVGLAYALAMSGGFGRAYERTHGMAWCACLLGLWTIIAPWAVAGSVHTTRTIVNNVVTGAVAFLLALAAAATARAAESSTRRGGMAAR
ncbi:SPW repeat protein [Streptomyces sp. NPDC051987]|uniref:SPW repeat protein n=1 Tax=Streptomyces sp. NPDC051987 TaxID=3155808 RepID=UPI00342098E7